MINLKRLRDAPEETKAALSRRYPEVVGELEHILALDDQRRDTIKEVERLKADRNRASEEVARRKKEGDDAADLLATLRELSGRIKDLDRALRETETSLRTGLLRIPNIPGDDLPTGGAEANVEVRSWGDRPSFTFRPKPHWEVAEHLGIIDFARGAKVAGSGFVMYRGKGARLVRGLINFMLDVHAGEHGYEEVWPPVLINEESALGTGQLPDLENQMYAVEADGLFLIPTAEVPVTNLHRDEILDGARLPIAYAAYTPCFRREAGAHGKDTRGITRVHQFDKVELVRFCRPETSEAEHERLQGHVEVVLQRLGLPYRAITLASGDVGFASAKTIDFEAWASGVETWLEVSSASTFTDFQARRANIRYRPEGGGRPEFVHTLNASGLALPRTLIALLENNQQADGSVVLPEALAPFVGFDRLTPDA